MSRNRVIIDCYTDEPAGLGVPPYLGVWPRYAAGQYKQQLDYLTIDDLRLALYSESPKPVVIDRKQSRTRIEVLNHTRSPQEIKQILNEADQVIAIVGVQTPGKYLSARPGTLNELSKLLKPYKIRKILTGPVVSCGTQFRGGSKAVMPQARQFDEIRLLEFDSYTELSKTAIAGAYIYQQFPHRQNCIIEIETGKGCTRSPGCSFCTEPIKNTLQWRNSSDIENEIKALIELGAKAFRLGKQSCIFSYQGGELNEIEKLLKPLADLKPHVLHIDNVNPTMVTAKKARLFIDYLTPGSTAAMGIESFDPQVTQRNNLNCTFETAFEAIRIINRIGGFRGENGCHALLPGINILLGLDGETTDTLEKNYQALKMILDEGLLVRRINIRQVVPYPGTALYENVGQKYLKKNRKYYPAWTEKVRREIDAVLLRRLFPEGTILKNLCSEVHNGNVTFLRQVGSYPIVVGVNERLPLGEFFDVKVTGYMLRSLRAEIIKPKI